MESRKRKTKYQTFYEKEKRLHQLLREHASDILESKNFARTKEHIQHGNMTVHQHCQNVAKYSVAISEFLKIRCSKRDLIRGALLHDYFLYDWHNNSEEASNNPNKVEIPSKDILEEASKHTSIDLLEIDEKNKTVRITDPLASIDVGAIGKGYATEKAAQYLESKNISSYVLNIGGNIRIIGTKVDGDGWITGIKNPIDPETYAFYTKISDISCVTSGDYERYFMKDNVKYHHIIDKDTLMPANYFSSITILTKDSGLADTLSTALFCMSYEEGRALVESLGNVEVLWIFQNGDQQKTEGMIPEVR